MSLAGRNPSPATGGPRSRRISSRQAARWDELTGHPRVVPLDSVPGQLVENGQSRGLRHAAAATARVAMAVDVRAPDRVSRAGLLPWRPVPGRRVWRSRWCGRGR
jgi:hypothetical protein